MAASRDDLESGHKRLASAFTKLPALDGLADHKAFERLSAMVIHHWLGERAVHDTQLRGTSAVPHQIDVLVGDDRQRGLIECKYYGENVDLPIVRNFFGVVEDLGCDLAAIITTKGYSENAKKYAVSKGIDLLVLRDVEADDLTNRILSVHLDLTAFLVELTSCRMSVCAENSDAREFQGSVRTDDPSVILEYSSGRSEPFGEKYRLHHDSFGFQHEDGIHPVADVFDEPTWLTVGAERYPVERIDWEFRVSRSTTTSEIRHEPLVSLIGADGEVIGVFTEEQLNRVRFERMAE